MKLMIPLKPSLTLLIAFHLVLAPLSFGKSPTFDNEAATSEKETPSKDDHLIEEREASSGLERFKRHFSENKKWYFVLAFVGTSLMFASYLAWPQSEEKDNTDSPSQPIGSKKTSEVNPAPKAPPTAPIKKTETKEKISAPEVVVAPPRQDAKAPAKAPPKKIASVSKDRDLPLPPPSKAEESPPPQPQVKKPAPVVTQVPTKAPTKPVPIHTDKGSAAAPDSPPELPRASKQEQQDPPATIPQSASSEAQAEEPASVTSSPISPEPTKTHHPVQKIQFPSGKSYTLLQIGKNPQVLSKALQSVEVLSQIPSEFLASISPETMGDAAHLASLSYLDDGSVKRYTDGSIYYDPNNANLLGKNLTKDQREKLKPEQILAIWLTSPALDPDLVTDEQFAGFAKDAHTFLKASNRYSFTDLAFASKIPFRATLLSPRIIFKYPVSDPASKSRSVLVELLSSYTQVTRGGEKRFEPQSLGLDFGQLDAMTVEQIYDLDEHDPMKFDALARLPRPTPLGVDPVEGPVVLFDHFSGTLKHRIAEFGTHKDGSKWGSKLRKLLRPERRSAFFYEVQNTPLKFSLEQLQDLSESEEHFRAFADDAFEALAKDNFTEEFFKSRSPEQIANILRPRYLSSIKDHSNRLELISDKLLQAITLGQIEHLFKVRDFRRSFKKVQNRLTPAQNAKAKELWKASETELLDWSEEL